MSSSENTNGNEVSSTGQVATEVVPVGEHDLQKPIKKDKDGALVALTFDKDGKEQFLHFRPRDYRFLSAIIEYQGDVRLAARKVNMNACQVSRFFKKQEVKKWLKDRMKEVAIRNGVTVEWWVSKLKDVADGITLNWSGAQSDAMKLLGKYLKIDDKKTLIVNPGSGRTRLAFVMESEGSEENSHD